MGIFNNMAKVAAARARVTAAREDTVRPAAALIARGYEHPLTVLGIAAGSGFLLSNVKLNPLAVPGVSGVVAGGVADLIAHGVSIAAGSFLGEFASDAVDGADEVP